MIRTVKRIFPILIVLMFASGAYAQTPDVNNPSAIAFTASADHSGIDSYEVDILRPDGSVLQTLNIGKPVPDASNTCTAPLNVQPIAFANGYSVRLRAKAGTAVSDYAVSENKFNRVPGSPTKVVVK
jgi:hypothetical protein